MVSFLFFLQVKVEGHGSWAAEDSVSAKECQEGTREEEGCRRRPEDCSEGRTGPYLPRLSGEYCTRSRVLIRCGCFSHLFCFLSRTGIILPVLSKAVTAIVFIRQINVLNLIVLYFY